MANPGAGASIAIAAALIIILATSFAFYYSDIAKIDSLSSSLSSENRLINQLNQEVAMIQGNSTTTTSTSISTSTITFTSSVVDSITIASATTKTLESVTTLTLAAASASLVTVVSSTSIYPVPDNLSVLFTNVSGGYDYSITAGNSTFTGSSSTELSVPLTSLFQGETIAIAASETGTFGCDNGQTVTAELYLNGQIVAQGTQTCGGSDIQISYKV